MSGIPAVTEAVDEASDVAEPTPIKAVLLNTVPLLTQGLIVTCKVSLTAEAVFAGTAEMKAHLRSVMELALGSVSTHVVSLSVDHWTLKSEVEITLPAT